MRAYAAMRLIENLQFRKFVSFGKFRIYTCSIRKYVIWKEWKEKKLVNYPEWPFLKFRCFLNFEINSFKLFKIFERKKNWRKTKNSFIILNHFSADLEHLEIFNDFKNFELIHAV